MEQLNFITNILGIKDKNIIILDYLDAGTHKEIIAKLDYPAPKCLDCQGQMAKYDFQKESKITYLECAGYKTLIRLSPKLDVTYDISMSYEAIIISLSVERISN